MSIKRTALKMFQIVVTIGLLVFVAFSSSHEHVSQAELVGSEHVRMDHGPNPVQGTHSETCLVHVACSLAAMSVQPNLAIALPLSKAMALSLYDLVHPSALLLTETPPPRV